MTLKPTVQSEKIFIGILILGVLMLSSTGKPIITNAQFQNSSISVVPSGQTPVRANTTIASSNTPIKEIPLPDGSQPLGITLDNKDNVWLAENNPARIVEFNPSNQTFKNYPIPMNGTSMIWFMVFDSRGNLWFANQVQPYLWRFTPSTGQFANFTTGNQYVRPFGLAYEPNTQQIWFTSTYTDQIGYFNIYGQNAVLGNLINATGTPILPNPPLYGPTGIQIGPNGNIFVSEPFSGNVVEYSPAAQKFVNVWKLPKGSQPVGISLDNTTKSVWFANHASSLFGYVDENTGQVHEFATSPFEFFGDTITLPYWARLTSNGTVWFDEHASNKMARYYPGTGMLTEFAVPTNRSAPLHFVIDNQRKVIWFTEFFGSNLASVDENASCSCSVQLSERNLTLSSAPISFYLKYQTVGGHGLATGSPKPLIAGTFELDGFATNNLTESYSIVNSSYYRITLSRGPDLVPGNYSITVCPRSTSSDNITSPSPVRQCATASLSVIGSQATTSASSRTSSSSTAQSTTQTNHTTALNTAAIVLAVVAVATTIILSLIYVRRWRAS